MLSIVANTYFEFDNMKIMCRLGKGKNIVRQERKFTQTDSFVEISKIIINLVMIDN